MAWYRVASSHGRRLGAIGRYYPVAVEVEAESREQAIQEAYKTLDFYSADYQVCRLDLPQPEQAKESSQ